MLIKKATGADAGVIAQLANKVKVGKGKIEGGFLVYVLDESGYRRRIGVSQYVYIAKDQGRTEGFLTCYDSSSLQNLIESGELGHEDGIINFVAKQPSPFIFGDQIAVDPECSRRGIGEKMIQRLFGDMRKAGISRMYVAISHSPENNETSRRFCTKLGFRQVAEVTNKDSRVWGIYLKEI